MLRGRFVLGTNRIGFLTLGLLASLVACSSPTSPPSTVPSSTTSTTEATGTYRPNNPDPVSAVEAFLTAEIDGDFGGSFKLLAEADQAAAGDPAAWVAEHYLVIPTIRGFQLTADSAEGTKVEVRADLILEAGLDQVVGLTPAEADSNWVVVEEAGEWRISFTQSGIEPRYLDDAAAPAAVERWAVQRQKCESVTEWDASLLGYPSLAEALCGSEGTVAAGTPGLLADAAESAPFLAAFGPDVGRWARVVPVDGAHPFRAVTAPIGNEWVVIGVLDA
jgi:hypothetical protein